MHNPTEIHNDFIFVYDKVISETACSEIIEKFKESNKKFLGRTTSGISDKKKSKEVYIDKNDLYWKQIDDMLFEVYRDFAASYLSTFPWVNMRYRDKGYFIKKYEKGHGYFGTHVDVSCLKNSKRMLVMIIYLNTLEEGGETNFDYLNVKVAPVTGRLLIFPPMWMYPHQGLKPLSDHKYTVNTFLEFI